MAYFALNKILLMRWYLLLMFCCSVVTSYCANVTGHVKTAKGEPLPFASILVKKSTIGTTANNKGFYSLQLAPGKYQLICQHVGYKAVEKEIIVSSSDTTIHFDLEEQDYNLATIVIKKGGEDPAYEIIRNAIRKRVEHLNELKDFQCEVYIKGQLQLRDFPKKFLGTTIDFEDGDSSKKKMIYLAETLAKYSVQKPNQSKIEMLSTRVSGNSNGFGFASPEFISFYENNVQLGSGLNPRGFISPIASSALNYYRYKFEGSFFENGLQISHIKVIPKRMYEPLFYGYINIVENEWRIHSVQLELRKASQMQLLDTLKIDQIHVPAGKAWVIKQQVIYPAGKIFGFDFYGSFVQVYNKFNIDPVFAQNYFNNTILKVYDSANKKSIQYWDTIRPIPLLDEEVKDYKKKDSLEQVRKDPKYLDSLDKKANRFSLGKLLLGYTYNSRKAKLNIAFSSLLDMINFNTVEGAVVNLSSTITKQYENRRSWSLTPVLRYGFSNERFNAHLNGKYRFGKKYSRSLSFSVGSNVFQFNNEQPILPRINTIATLNGVNNFMKIYEARFAKLNYSTVLGYGLSLRLETEFQARTPLENTTNYTWRKRNNVMFSPNYPTEIMSQNMTAHEALSVSAEIRWQPGMKYVELPDRKYEIGSKYPSFSFNLTKGVHGLFGSDVQYSKWRVSMNDDLNIKLGGSLNYRLAIGGFLQAKNVFVPDYTHFQGNQLYIAAPYVNSFQLMNYYRFSNTAGFYSEGHVEYHFNGLLTNKIPLFRRLNWFLVAGSNSMFIDKDRYHAELFVGMENIFKVLRIDYIMAWQKNQQLHGIRLGLPITVTGEKNN